MSRKRILTILATIIVAALVATAVFMIGKNSASSGNDLNSPNPATDRSISSQQDKSDNQSTTDKTEAVSLQQAGKIVTDKYGGTIKSIESDDYRGQPAWEVEVRDSSQGRIEVKVSKASGEILSVEND